MNDTNEGLKKEQLDLLEVLLLGKKKQKRFCDVHFIVEGEDFKCVGALLANSCAYFEKLLYGNFKEANSRDPIILKNVKKEGFLCVLRFCYGLDPKLTGKNVVATHRVSEMWGIDVLSRMCALFLVKDVIAENVLDVYSSLLDTPLALEVEKRFWDIILEEPSKVLDSESFLACDFRIIKKIINTGQFCVPEEKLWTRCLERNQKKELPSIIDSMRFPLMKAEFFSEHVCHHLQKEDSDSVFMEFLIKKKSRFTSSPRFREFQPYKVTNASTGLDYAQGLPTNSGNWPYCSSFPQHIELSFPTPINIQEITLTETSTNIGDMTLETIDGKTVASWRMQSNQQKVPVTSNLCASSYKLSILNYRSYGYCHLRQLLFKTESIYEELLLNNEIIQKVEQNPK